MGRLRNIFYICQNARVVVVDLRAHETLDTL